MENIIIVVILAAIVCGILLYLIKARKHGEKCIGCPYAKQCGRCGKGCDHAKSDNKSSNQ